DGAMDLSRDRAGHRRAGVGTFQGQRRDLRQPRSGGRLAVRRHARDRRGRSPVRRAGLCQGRCRRAGQPSRRGPTRAGGRRRGSAYRPSGRLSRADDGQGARGYRLGRKDRHQGSAGRRAGTALPRPGASLAQELQQSYGRAVEPRPDAARDHLRLIRDG
ncbi:MAG: UDP-N-acetylmuramoyl-tripeptide--D-alanyl-D-alanine ligase, partial [uncultured Sphingomonas sp.]